MKRILFLSHTSNLNGAEQNLFDIIKGLNKSEFTAFLTVPFKEGTFLDEAKKNNIDVRYIPYRSWINHNSISRKFIAFIRNAFSFFSIIRLIVRNKIDIVYTNSATIISGAIAAKLCGKKNIWHIHEVIGGAATEFKYYGSSAMLCRIINFLADIIIVNSIYVKNLFPEKCFHKIRIVYNSFDKEEISASVDLTKESNLKQAWLKQYKGKRKILAIVGGICARKGQSFTIEAMPEILASFPDFLLVLVGSDSDPRKINEKQLKERIVKLGLQKDVLFAGHYANIHAVYPAIDLLLVPSLSEAFGRVAVEAMFHKVPVIATKVGGLKEIIDHEITGFLINPKSSKEIAETVVSVFSGRYDIKKMVAEACCIAKEKYNKETMNSTVEKILLE